MILVVSSVSKIRTRSTYPLWTRTITFMGKANKKPQGKLDVSKVLEGLHKGMKKKDIAEYAGSLAQSDEAKANAVTRVMRSDEFKSKAHDLIERSYAGITDEKIARAGYAQLVKGIEQLSKVGGLAEAQQVEVNNTQINIDLDGILTHYAKQGETNGSREVYEAEAD